MIERQQVITDCSSGPGMLTLKRIRDRKRGTSEGSFCETG